MEHQTTQNAIEARRSHLNGLDGEIVAYDQKIENRGTEMLFLQGYMRKQNGIKNTTVWSHINNVVIRIVYNIRTSDRKITKKQKKNKIKKILAFSGSSAKINFRYEKSTRIAVQMLISLFKAVVKSDCRPTHF